MLLCYDLLYPPLKLALQLQPLIRHLASSLVHGSLFSLTPSRPSEEATTTTSTTSSIMTVARSIKRRLSSSTTLRVTPMVDHEAVEGKKSLHSQDHDDVFEGTGRTLSRKKRLQSPVAVHPPPQIGSNLSKKVSRTSLSSPPIAISLRPGTADSFHLIAP
ncbi:hypothetical protein FA13DRAFT_949724 [Coprinellus micaceus]|uniref:Uncharacterized protein n=1 Tax=Coprinellus micaceus TaxID=71717 RepID=A0A4Y7RZY7_COPMI|nr:hypothetical protein FA13DRAFT_949724 [Coprinellus micaceus]